MYRALIYTYKVLNETVGTNLLEWNLSNRERGLNITMEKSHK